eukprot:scaffold104405_cov20-Tisochrysis_lutea.AAC.3
MLKVCVCVCVWWDVADVRGACLALAITCKATGIAADVLVELCVVWRGITMCGLGTSHVGSSAGPAVEIARITLVP